MSREVRRVPLDFDFPLDKTWTGYLVPEELQLPLCPDCRYPYGGGTHGQSKEYHLIYLAFWEHNWPEGQKHLAWRHDLTQADIDYLADRELFYRTVHVEKSEMYPNGWYYEYFRPTLAEVQKANEKPSLFDPLDLGSGKLHYLVERRCALQNFPTACGTCHGKGHVATRKQKRAHDAWKPTEPPTGEGWQLWQTVSEGGPISPVFGTPDELATWMASPAYSWGNRNGLLPQITYEQALAFIGVGFSVGSGMVTAEHGLESGEATMGRIALEQP